MFIWKDHWVPNSSYQAYKDTSIIYEGNVC